MTDVSASAFAEVCLREVSAPAAPRRQAPLKQASAPLRRETALSQPDLAKKVVDPLPEPRKPEPGLAEPQAALAASVLEWLRQTPGHWRGRAFARRELAGTAGHDAEHREHLAMADLYDRISLSREAVNPLLPAPAELERWRWRPEAAAAIPADHAAEGLRRCSGTARR